MLVSTVTAINLGRRVLPSSAARASCIMARPPLACTLIIHTPSFAAALQALATVFGMS